MDEDMDERQYNQEHTCVQADVTDPLRGKFKGLTDAADAVVEILGRVGTEIRQSTSPRQEYKEDYPGNPSPGFRGICRVATAAATSTARTRPARAVVEAPVRQDDER